MDRPFSHIVTTHDILVRLRESIHLPPEDNWPSFSLVGIRVESRPTREEAVLRACELRRQGHKVQLMMA